MPVTAWRLGLTDTILARQPAAVPQPDTGQGQPEPPASQRRLPQFVPLSYLVDFLASRRVAGQQGSHFYHPV
jgi:hypothetical protein